MSGGMTGKIKRALMLVLILAAVLSLSGCKTEEEKNSPFKLYVIDKNSSTINAVGYTPTGENDYDKVLNTFKALQNYSDNKSISPFPKDVQVLGTNITKDTLSVYFGENYYSLSLYDEAISRAAIVKTMCQFASIAQVTFYVGSVELNIQGKTIGPMRQDAFLDDIMMTEGTMKLSLFFPIDGSDKLREVIREVKYNSAYTDEQLIIEELLDGPKSNEGDLKKCFPDGTRLLNVVTKDMVCYVNLSAEFYNYRTDTTDVQTIYSIVNSLTSIPGISSVVITIAGSSVEYYGSVACNGFLNYNYDLIEQAQ